MQLSTEDNDPKYVIIINGLSEDMLCEIRFYVPPGAVDPKLEKKKNESKDDGI
jgi:hypothetical protein